MAKFASFVIGGSEPLEEYEGHHMEAEKEFVRIYKQGTIDLGTMTRLTQKALLSPLFV